MYINLHPGNYLEALETLDSLIPQLHHGYREDIYSFFHPEAVTVSLQVHWDPTSKITTSPDDKAFQRCLNGDNEYNFVVIETNKGTLEIELNKHIHGVSSYLQPSSQTLCLLSTFWKKSQ